MFEPIHGSAPKYRGKNLANPIATVWAGALLLDSLGEHEAADGVVRAIEQTIADGIVTRDMGGASSTSGVGDHLVHLLERRS
jgi:3-isopropylmalate dehydrogenase